MSNRNSEQAWTISTYLQEVAVEMAAAAWLRIRYNTGEFRRDSAQKAKERAMNWRERITIDPHILVGKPIIKGTRMSVEFVVDLLGRGWTMEQIINEYNHVTPEDVQACLAYASEVLQSERVYLLSAR
jgi:uncharacterized protein (DUF433 family)